VYPSHSVERLIRKTRDEVVLCLPVPLIIQIVDCEIEIDSMPNSFRDAKI